jgi:hypothetical protein
MPRFEIKVTGRPDIPEVKFSRAQMEGFATFGAKTVKERVDSPDPRTATDQPASPLSDKGRQRSDGTFRPGYKTRKARMGKRPVRDLKLTGGMLDALQAQESDEQHAVFGIRASAAFRKGLFNQQREEWFTTEKTETGLAPSDERKLNARVEQVFDETLARAGAK